MALHGGGSGKIVVGVAHGEVFVRVSICRCRVHGVGEPVVGVETVVVTSAEACLPGRWASCESRSVSFGIEYAVVVGLGDGYGRPDVRFDDIRHKAVAHSGQLAVVARCKHRESYAVAYLRPKWHTRLCVGEPSVCVVREQARHAVGVLLRCDMPLRAVREGGGGRHAVFGHGYEHRASGVVVGALGHAFPLFSRCVSEHFVFAERVALVVASVGYGPDAGMEQLTPFGHESVGVVIQRFGSAGHEIPPAGGETFWGCEMAGSEQECAVVPDVGDKVVVVEIYRNQRFRMCGFCKRQGGGEGVAGRQGIAAGVSRHRKVLGNGFQLAFCGRHDG